MADFISISNTGLNRLAWKVLAKWYSTRSHLNTFLMAFLQKPNVRLNRTTIYNSVELLCFAKKVQKICQLVPFLPVVSANELQNHFRSRPLAHFPVISLAIYIV